MANANFYLRSKANSAGENPIYMVYWYNNERFTYGTRKTISSDYWNEEKQLARKNYSNCDSLNKYLEGLNTKVKDIHNLALSNQVPLTNDYFKAELDKRVNKMTVKGKQIIDLPDQKKTFVQIYTDFLAMKSLEMEERTIAKYKTLLKVLIAFGKEYRIDLDNLDNWNQDFYLAFLQFEANNGKVNETTSKEVVNIKSFLGYCFDKDYINNNKYVKYFKVIERDLEVVALGNDELMKLFRFDLSENQNWNRILKGMVFKDGLDKNGKPKFTPLTYNSHWCELRDVWCFAAFTSLRYQDYFDLHPSNIKDGYISFTTNKGRNTHQIAISPYAQEILSKYNNELPKFSNAYINREIKKIGQVVGFTEEIMITRYYGKHKVDTIYKKYELMKHHMGRKTFATVSLQRGMRQETVAQQGNWRKMSTMKRYINIAKSMIEDEMKEAWSTDHLPNKKKK